MKLSVWSMLVFLAGTPAVFRAQDLETTVQGLKDAEAKSDAAQVKRLAAETFALARKAAGEPAPEDADEKDAWTKRVAYAKDVDNYAEGALYAVAVRSEPAVTVDLLAALEDANPKSKYLDESYANYLYALSQTGATAKIPAIAEKALGNFPDNPDLLLFLANNAMGTKQSARAQTYATRLVAAAGRRPKPEGVSEADWEKKKTAWVGRGYWISGVLAGEGNQYAAADKNLRAALPYLKGNDAMMGPALFHLGVANYNLGKMSMNKAKVLEGAKFSDQCAAITGPYAEQAYKNAAIMKADAGKMR
jgi:tetratricopeptide (TPR) repeat protein